MAVVEGSGRNVEEAVEHALAELGLTREDVQIDVLTEGRSGVLGVGGSEARVRVTPLSEVPPPAEEPEGEAAEGGGEPVDDEAEIAAQMLDKLLELMGIAQCLRFGTKFQREWIRVRNNV
jgi:spoIIIJ-associated protein